MKSSSYGNAVCLLICTFLPIATPVLSQAASNSDDQRLIEIEHQMNEAEAQHNADQMSRYLDDAYLVKDTMGGKVYDKSATLASIRLDAEAEHKTGQSQPAPRLEGLKTAVLDGSALAVFNFTVGTEKQTLHCQITDTFLKRTDGWKLVGRAGICH